MSVARSEVCQRKYAERSRRIVNRLVSAPAPVLPDPSLVTGGSLCRPPHPDPLPPAGGEGTLKGALALKNSLSRRERDGVRGAPRAQAFATRSRTTATPTSATPSPI